MLGFLTAALYCAPDTASQLFLASLWAVFWYHAMPWLMEKVIRPYELSVYTLDQLLYLQQKALKDSYGIVVGKKDTLEFVCSFQVVLFQHLVGGLLCVPAVFFPGVLFSNETATALACHGALCEMGWEIEDSLCRLRILFFGTPEEKAREPAVMMFLFLTHHVLTLVCAIPMNIYFREDPSYHEMVFGLQAIAFVSLFLGFRLIEQDMQTKEGLFRMRVMSTVQFGFTTYYRVFRFIILSYRLLSGPLWVNEPFPGFWWGGLIGLLGMSLINLLFFAEHTSRFLLHVVIRVSDKKTGTVLGELNRKAQERMASGGPAALLDEPFPIKEEPGGGSKKTD